ncbi:sensor histidine kinase [Paenibacillus albicereus]|uniref:histidine kinase n=1 Tax=Paenibacillus albicereus TaxID=2726185 RepID=A0A6H2GVR1_9BACL|nr:sensor histidine kinase [Paenibacillus albicereus]QJC51514.1 sensor histidine kinase [Paenibacillus albicereus]
MRVQTHRAYKLRSILIACLVANILLSMLLIGGLSYYSMQSVLRNKVEKGVQLNVRQVAGEIGNAIQNLESAAKQMAISGTAAGRLKDYMASTGYAKVQNKQDLDDLLGSISYSNASLGLIGYFDPKNGEMLLSTQLARPDAQPDSFTALSAKGSLEVQGIHPSLYLYGSKQLVLSVIQPVQLQADSPRQAYAYAETNYNVVDQLLSDGRYGFPARYILADKQGRIVYSQLDAYPVGSQADIGFESVSDERTGLVLFHEASSEGWHLLLAVDPGFYRSELDQWLGRFIVFAALCLVISLAAALFVWRLIQSRLTLLRGEIESMADSHFEREHHPVRILEFDVLLLRFAKMRQRIGELLLQVEEKERRKRHLEVEKLKYQINPHFIHNTLNTIQWMARMSKQEDIFDMVAVFSRILQYNLSKEGDWVTVAEELEAIEDYMKLQRIRYNYQFRLEISLEDKLKEQRIPRFIVQPLVENAMYHGFTDQNGCVTVRVRREGAVHYAIEVSDDGIGMDSQALERLLEESDESSRKSGLGIGLSFVDRSIRTHFGEPYRLHAASSPGEGTTMSIILPIRSHEEEPT